MKENKSLEVKKLNGLLRGVLIFYIVFYIIALLISPLSLIINSDIPTIIGYSRLEIFISSISTIIILFSFALILKCKKIGVVIYGITCIFSTIYGFSTSDYRGSILSLIFMFFLGYLIYKDRALFK